MIIEVNGPKQVLKSHEYEQQLKKQEDIYDLSCYPVVVTGVSVYFHDIQQQLGFFLCVMKASSYKLYSNKKCGNTLTACTQVFIHDRVFLMWKKSKTRPELTTNALLIGIILCVCLLFASINKLHIFSHCSMRCVEVVFSLFCCTYPF